MEVREIADLIHEHRASGTAGRGPAGDPWREHEVVEDELAAPLEQIDERRAPFGTFEHVLLVDLRHGRPAALGGKRIALASRLLFLREQFLMCGKPVGLRYDVWNCSAALRGHDDAPCASWSVLGLFEDVEG